MLLKRYRYKLESVILRKLSYFILFVGFVICVSSCSEAAKTNKAEEIRKEQFKKDVIEMALKYNAISNTKIKYGPLRRRGIYTLLI